MAALTFRGTEIRDLTVRSCWFGIVSGYFDGVDVRGRDAVIVGAHGQFATSRKAHVRAIRLTGYALGEDEENWAEVAAELEAIFDPTLLPGTLEVTAPYMGLDAGVRTIEARTADYRTIDRVPFLVTEYDVTLIAVGDPVNGFGPDWEAIGS